MDPRIVRSRSAVVQAATQVLLEAGAGAVTVEAVVQRSGVARSTLYRHFPTSTDVLRAAVDAVIPGADTTAPPVDLLEDPAAVRAALQSYLVDFSAGLRSSDWAQVLPGLLDLLARDPSLEDHRRELVQHHRRPLRALLLSAQRAQLLAGSADLDAVAAMVVGPLFYRRHVSGEELTDAVCRDVVDSVLGRG